MNATLNQFSYGRANNLVEASSWLDDIKSKRLFAFNSMHYESLSIIQGDRESLPFDDQAAYAKKSLVKP